MSGVGAGAGAMGLQVVIFPWLVVGVLNEPAERVGLAQSAVMLPSLLFIVLGGAISDKLHLGSHLFRLFMLYSLPFVLLLWANLSGNLDYSWLILFALCYGSITAFVQPARESLLPQVYVSTLQQSVARSTFVQFAAQSLGVLAAGLFDLVGLTTLLCMQMIMVVTAALMFRRSQPPHEGIPGGRYREKLGIISGFVEVWRHPRLRALMSVVGATGFLGFGAYLVAMPLMTREVYHGGAWFFAALQFSFTFGVLFANLLFIRWGGVLDNPGRVLVISLFCRGLILILIAMHLPLWALFPSIAMWGMFTGMSITLGRVLTHSEALESHRARVISIYQLSFFGTAPIGAWLAGELIADWGVLSTLMILGVCTLLASMLGVFSQLWRTPEKSV
ncbi:MAG: MFS transporter [Porticoccaceae bacterium]